MAAAFLATVGTISSCSSDDDLSAEELAALQSSANDGSLTEILLSADITNTRAYDDQWETYDSIGVYVTGESTTYYANTPYYTDDEGTTCSFQAAEDTMYYPSDGSAVDVLAYYPYTDALSGTTFAIDVSDQTDQPAIDLLQSSLVEGKSESDPSVSLTFYHKLSMVELYIAHSEVMESDISGLNATVGGQYTTATFDVADSDAAVEATGDTSTVTFNIDSSADTLVEASAILIPGEVTGGYLVTLKDIDDYDNFTFSMSDYLDSLSSGKRYIFNINLDRKAIGTPTYHIDTDGDGDPDITITPGDDEDGDGEPDSWDVDTDGDGEPDATITPGDDEDGDGDPDSWDIDTDGDGDPDGTITPGDDEDGDGDPDSWVVDDDGDDDPDYMVDEEDIDESNDPSISCTIVDWTDEESNDITLY